MYPVLQIHTKMNGNVERIMNTLYTLAQREVVITTTVMAIKHMLIEVNAIVKQ